jgi:hypothetical protein
MQAGKESNNLGWYTALSGGCPEVQRNGLEEVDSDKKGSVRRKQLTEAARQRMSG